MAKYFQSFPIIEYQGKRVRDITRRNRFSSYLSTNPFLYLPYTVKDDMRAEDVALFYYGSVDYVWLVYLANNIIDPYHEWPMDEKTFNDFLIEKYTDVSGKQGQDVVDWTRDPDIDENILYWYKEV